jgi:hypothetical protein
MGTHSWQRCQHSAGNGAGINRKQDYQVPSEARNSKEVFMTQSRKRKQSKKKGKEQSEVSRKGAAPIDPMAEQAKHQQEGRRAKEVLISPEQANRELRRFFELEEE